MSRLVPLGFDDGNGTVMATGENLEICRLYELDNISSCLEKVNFIQQKQFSYWQYHWKHGKKGSGVFWLQQVQDDVRLNRIAQQFVESVGKPVSDDSFKQWEGLIELLGSEASTAGGLEFLHKYKDFKKSLQKVQDGKASDAARQAIEYLIQIRVVEMMETLSSLTQRTALCLNYYIQNNCGFLTRWRKYENKMSFPKVESPLCTSVWCDLRKFEGKNKFFHMLMKNPSTPERFWLPLLLDSLNLLNWRERPLMNVSETNLLLSKLQELSLARLRPGFYDSHLPPQAQSSVRLALATNLGRAILE